MGDEKQRRMENIRGCCRIFYGGAPPCPSKDQGAISDLPFDVEVGEIALEGNFETALNLDRTKLFNQSPKKKARWSRAFSLLQVED